MGVFARLLRRSKAAEEALTEVAEEALTEVAAEVTAATAEAGRATEESGREPAAAEEPAEAAATGPEAAPPVGTAGPEGPRTADGAVQDVVDTEANGNEGVADAGADPVEIPKQPSGEAAADRAAGEGARR